MSHSDVKLLFTTYLIIGKSKSRMRCKVRQLFCFTYILASVNYFQTKILPVFLDHREAKRFCENFSCTYVSNNNNTYGLVWSSQPSVSESQLNWSEM